MAGWSSLRLSKSQCACSCPSSLQVPGHSASATGEIKSGHPRGTAGRPMGPTTRPTRSCWHVTDMEASIPQTTRAVPGRNGGISRPRPPLQDSRVRARCWWAAAAKGWALGAPGALPPHSQPLFTSEGQQQGVGADAVKNQVLTLVLLSQGHHLKLLPSS